MYFKSTIIACIVFVCIFSCSEKNSYNINNINEFSISNGNILSSNIVSGYLNDFVVLKGNVIASDYIGKSLFVINKMDSLNTYKEFKFEGRGPGEYLNIDHIDGHGDHLFLLDTYSRLIIKYLIINDSLSYRGDYLVPNPEGMIAKEFSVIDDRTVIIGFMKGFAREDLRDERSLYLKKLNLDTYEYTDLLEVPAQEYYKLTIGGGFSVGPKPFGYTPHFETSINSVFQASNTSLEINEIDLFGNKVSNTKIKLFENNKKAVTDLDIMNWMPDMFSSNQQAQIRFELSESWPIYSGFFIDDNDQIWLSPNIDEFEEYKLWIFFDRETGGPLGKIILNRPSRLVYKSDNILVGYSQVNNKTEIIAFEIN